VDDGPGVYHRVRTTDLDKLVTLIPKAPATLRIGDRNRPAQSGPEVDCHPNRHISISLPVLSTHSPPAIVRVRTSTMTRPVYRPGHGGRGSDEVGAVDRVVGHGGIQLGVLYPGVGLAVVVGVDRHILPHRDRLELAVLVGVDTDRLQLTVTIGVDGDTVDHTVLVQVDRDGVDDAVSVGVGGQGVDDAVTVGVDVGRVDDAVAVQVDGLGLVVASDIGVSLSICVVAVDQV
jgi:hypothetical protein